MKVGFTKISVNFIQIGRPACPQVELEQSYVWSQGRSIETSAKAKKNEQVLGKVSLKKPPFQRNVTLKNNNVLYLCVYIFVYNIFMYIF